MPHYGSAARPRDDPQARPPAGRREPGVAPLGQLLLPDLAAAARGAAAAPAPVLAQTTDRRGKETRSPPRRSGPRSPDPVRGLLLRSADRGNRGDCGSARAPSVPRFDAELLCSADRRRPLAPPTPTARGAGYPADRAAVVIRNPRVRGERRRGDPPSRRPERRGVLRPARLLPSPRLAASPQARVPCWPA